MENVELNKFCELLGLGFFHSYEAAYINVKPGMGQVCICKTEDSYYCPNNGKCSVMKLWSNRSGLMKCKASRISIKIKR